MKTPVINSKDYIVYLELYKNNTFIHCDCFKWSKNVKVNLLKDLDKLYSIFRKDIYAIHELNDNKHLKFLSLCGFKYLQDFTGDDQKVRQLFIRNKNGI